MTLARNLTNIAFRLQRRRSGLTRREVEIPGRLRYVYLQGGHGDPLLLLHGFGANKDNFTQLAGYLTPHYRVIAPITLGSASPRIRRMSITAQQRRPSACALSCARLASRGFTSVAIPWVGRSR